MSYFATVHTDRGECLKLLYGERPAVGSRLLGLLDAVGGCFRHMSEPTKFTSGHLAQFSQWAEGAQEKILNNAKVLHESWYGLQFSPYEYSAILQVMTESEDRQKWERDYELIAERWGELEPLIANVSGLLAVLTESELAANDWYDPEETVDELQILLDTLLLAKSRYAHKAIIQIQ